MATGQTQIAQLLLTTAQNNIIAGLGQEMVDPATGEKYFESGDEHMDCLKDILRQLRREHPTKRALYKNLGTLQVVQHKIIPLLLNHHGDDKLAFQVAKLLVMLTLPAEEVQGRQLEDRILVDYASCLAHNGAAVNIFVSQLPLDPSEATTDKSTMTMELMLTLFRNLLAIKNEQMTGSAMSSRTQVHEELILAFDREFVLYSIAELASLVELPQYAEWNLLLLELLYLVFVGHTPEAVAEAAFNYRPQKHDDESKDASVHVVDGVAPKQQRGQPRRDALAGVSMIPNRKALKGARHSHFGGIVKVGLSSAVQRLARGASNVANPHDVLQANDAKVKALSSKQRAHLSRARQAAKDMGFHLKSGAETAVAMRGEVADVMVRVARQLFENDGFNKLCRSLTKEFQKRSSKVIEADHVKLLHLVWFAQRLHRILESRDAQERKRRERAARNQVKKSAPSAKYTLDDDEEDNKSKPTAATRSETEQDLSPLPNPLDVAQVSSAVSAAVISWCCKSCQSYGFQKDRCVLQELKAKNHPASQNVYVSEVRLETPVAWQVHS
eukprot:INCI5898.17.p1 GENE.INCI5898.17~~INCI5898.17.p1  ORF type:complete len:556 (+),score=98.03 INCI5898.17:250-1917(+)